MNALDWMSSMGNPADRELAAVLIVNACRAKAVGALIRHTEPSNKGGDDPSIDAFNESFWDSTQDTPEWGVRRSHIENAKLWHACAEFVNFGYIGAQLPVDIDQMVRFMCTEAQKADREHLLNMVSHITGQGEGELRTIQQRGEHDRQMSLAERQPDIVDLYNGFGDSGYSEAFEELTEENNERLFESISSAIERRRAKLIEPALQGLDGALDVLRSLARLEARM